MKIILQFLIQILLVLLLLGNNPQSTQKFFEEVETVNMDAKNFLRIKPKDQVASQKAVQLLPNPKLEAQSELQPESIEKPPQSQKSQERAKLSPDAELQLPQEPVGYLESLTTIEREESIGSSGWGYSELLKEFRE